MATYNFTRISNVVRLSVDGGTPRLFVGQTATVIAVDATNISIQIGTAPFTVAYTDLRFGALSQSPSSIANAVSLLNSIFAS
jgi:hypothetical protein